MTKAVLLPTIVTTGLLIMAGTASADKPPGVQSLQGAWVEQSMNCADVYRSAGRNMVFRKDVSIFAPAFIISGRRIRTPGASCSIGRITYKGDRMILSLGCTTTITTSPVKAYLSISGDGTLYRYNDDVDHAGSKYGSCKP
jgi:hypothetical protein